MTPLHRPIPGWKPSTPPINSELFEQLLNDRSTFAIHFWASWHGCNPPLDQSIQSIAPDFAGRLSFYSCDVDREENVDLSKRCRVVTIPWLAVFVGGTEQRRIVGVLSPVELKNELTARFQVSRLPQKWWRLWK